MSETEANRNAGDSNDQHYNRGAGVRSGSKEAREQPGGCFCHQGLKDHIDEKTAEKKFHRNGKKIAVYFCRNTRFPAFQPEYWYAGLHLNLRS